MDQTSLRVSVGGCSVSLWIGSVTGGLPARIKVTRLTVHVCIIICFLYHTYMHSCIFTDSAVFLAAMKEERYRYGSGFDQVEDVMGVAQPVRFTSKNLITPPQT